MEIANAITANGFSVRGAIKTSGGYSVVASTSVLRTDAAIDMVAVIASSTVLDAVDGAIGNSTTICTVANIYDTGSPLQVIIIIACDALVRTMTFAISVGRSITIVTGTDVFKASIGTGTISQCLEMIITDASGAVIGVVDWAVLVINGDTIGTNTGIYLAKTVF